MLFSELGSIKMEKNRSTFFKSMYLGGQIRNNKFKRNIDKNPNWLEDKPVGYKQSMAEKLYF